MYRREYSTILVIALCFLCVSKLTQSSGVKGQARSLRLPSIVWPIKYYLHISTRIHQDILDFTGNVTIDLAVFKPAKEVVLHAKMLRDYVITITDMDTGSPFENVFFTHDNETSLLRIYGLETPLNLSVGGKYRLEILYSGDIQMNHFGLYKSTYQDHNKTIPMALTQFEPTSARMTFPCFDEPQIKSQFTITITHGKNYSAVSNMLADEVHLGPEDDMVTTKFKETPLMPTYLIAFVVSNYKNISEVVNGIEHRVFSPPTLRDTGYRTLKNSIKTVTALGDYLGIKYALEKLDHVWVENSYGLGMENWGLITYNMKSFLPTQEGEDKQYFLKLIIIQNHEIAHQWFGNLVSPSWWSYAWLNEGFATYFSYIAADLVYPKARIPELFIDFEAEVAFQSPISRPMTEYKETESDIKSVFDAVTYQKAACFVKMFHHAIGQKTFIKGLAMYLTKNQYSAANESNLFEWLQVAINEDNVQQFQGKQSIATVMHDWTHNEGIPIVTVIRNYGKGTITFRQTSTSKHSNETWWIPLNFASASSPTFDITVAQFVIPPLHEVTIDINEINIDIKDTDWLIVNKQQTGFMHVTYDDQNIEFIAETLMTNHNQIHLLNRCLLFRDLSVVLNNGLGEITSLLKILKYLQFENELVVWNSARDFIMDLLTNLHGTSAYELFKEFIRDLVKRVYEKYHQVPMSELAAVEIIPRSKIVEVACQADLIACLDYVKGLTKLYFYEGADIEVSLRDISLCHGIKHLTLEEFQELIAIVKDTSPNLELFDDIIYSSQCIQKPEVLRYFLHIMLEDNSTRPLMSEVESMQYLAYLYVANYFSRPILLKYMRDNYQTLCTRSKTIRKTLDKISRYVSEDDGEKQQFLDLLRKVKQFLQDSSQIEGRKIGSELLGRQQFQQKNGRQVYEWLKHQKSSKVASGAISIHAETAARYIVAAGVISNLVSLT